MAPDPYREQRISPAQVRRTLRRAAELAERDPETAGTERSLTREELDRAAADLGLPARAVASALDSEERPDLEQDQEHSWFIGAPTRILFERELAGEPSEADREDLVEDIRAELGDTGSTEIVGRTLVWKATQTLSNRGARELSVRLRWRDGHTRVVVEERLNRTATGLFVGLGVGGGIGALGGYIALVATLGLIGLVAPVISIPAMLLLARTIFGAVSRRRQRTLRKLVKRIEQSASRWPTANAPVHGKRVAIEEGVQAEAVPEAQARPRPQAEAQAKSGPRAEAEAEVEARLQAAAEAEAEDAAGGGARA